MEKAFALRDAREKSRQEYVQDCYNRQWRDACDDARLLDSKAMINFVNSDRLQQIKDKQARRQQLTQEENQMLAEYNKYFDKQIEKDRLKDESRHKASMDLMHGLKIQMNENQNKKVELFNRTMEEDYTEIESVIIYKINNIYIFFNIF